MRRAASAPCVQMSDAQLVKIRDSTNQRVTSVVHALGADCTSTPGTVVARAELGRVK